MLHQWREKPRPGASQGARGGAFTDLGIRTGSGLPVASGLFLELGQGQHVIRAGGETRQRGAGVEDE